MTDLVEFDGTALIAELDRRRRDEALDWNELATVLHGQSAVLNAELADNCMCSGALVRTARRGTMSCQYAMPLLRWVGRAPEEFLVGPVREVGEVRLPDAGPEHRLRWDLPRLHAELNAKRVGDGLTWAALAGEIGVTAARLTNLRTARLADMGLAMRVTQWVGRPAAAFVAPARW